MKVKQSKKVSISEPPASSPVLGRSSNGLLLRKLRLRSGRNSFLGLLVGLLVDLSAGLAGLAGVLGRRGRRVVGLWWGFLMSLGFWECEEFRRNS